MTTKKNAVACMPSVTALITDNATVMHISRISQEASGTVGQPYTIMASNLAAAKKAYESLGHIQSNSTMSLFDFEHPMKHAHSWERI